MPQINKKIANWREHNMQEIGIYTNRAQIVKKSGFVEHKRRRALNQVAQPGKGMTTNNQEITIKKHE